MKKGVIYARYSCDNQREESIEGQIRECAQFAKSNGIEIINTYCDRALSARSDNRPSFQRMINDSYNHVFDVVIVWKSDRFSRSRKQALDYRDILKSNGVKLLSCTEPNIEGPEQILYQGISDSYNEYYSSELSQKIKRGNKENVLKGHSNGGATPFGYKIVDKCYVIIPEEAKAVKEMFDQYLRPGFTISKLVKELKERGIKNHKGDNFSNGSIYNLLKNEKYIGIMRWGENVNDHCITPIVDKEVFDKVQEKITQNKKKGAYFKNENYILTPKLRCGECGGLLVGECGTSKSGKIHRYYRCNHSKGRNKSCSAKPIKQEEIEREVFRRTREWLGKAETLDILTEKVYQYQKMGNPLVGELEQKIADLEKRMNNIMNAIEAGMDPTDFKVRYSQLKEEKEGLLDRLYKEKVNNPIIDKEMLRHELSGFSRLDFKDDRTKKFILDTFVNDIYLYDNGKMVIIYSYSKIGKKIGLEELTKICSTPLSLASPLSRNRLGNQAFFVLFKP